MSNIELEEEFLEDYVIETEERLDRIASEILLLGSEKSNDRTILRREIQTLKELSAAIELRDISHLCHLMEHFLETVTDFKHPDQLQVLLDACDYIAVHRQALAAGETLPMISDAIFRRLRVKPIGLREQSSQLPEGKAEPIASEESGRQSPETNSGQNELSSPSTEKPQRRAKLLIVDDVLPNRELLLDILGEYGDCDLAVDGKEAVELFKRALISEKPYDAVCLDIMMPGFDGHVTLEMIRCFEHQHQIFGSAGVKVVMTTAAQGERHSVRAFKAGCQAYIKKPIDEIELVRTLQELQVFGPQKDCLKLSFLDDARQVSVCIDRNSSQMAEVVDESLKNINVLLEDVSHLRPGQDVELIYLGATVSTRVRTIEPRMEDGRFPICFDWV